jgi:hypothetical protein
MSANKHGLNRHLPEDVRRCVRIRCGFGCAICGTAITDYEHFYPDFVDAEKHDANKIVLLCPDHHRLVTNKIIPKEQVAAASENPAAIQNGFASVNHPWFNGLPSLQFGGGVVASGMRYPVRVYGTDLISFENPEEGSKVTRISAKIGDKFGKSILEIVDNEWKIFHGDLDFKAQGNRYIFKQKNGEIALQLRFEAPNLLSIEKMITVIKGIPIVVTEDFVKIATMEMRGGMISGGQIGICVN